MTALGLGRIGATTELKDTPQLQGQLRVVGHLVEVEELMAAARKKTEEEPKGREAEIGLHNLKPKPGARRPRKRLGRGEGSRGKTSGRGHKGYGSRAGSKTEGRLRGRAEPDSHADAQAARPAQEDVDAL